jgi:hypothetical protein
MIYLSMRHLYFASEAFLFSLQEAFRDHFKSFEQPSKLIITYFTLLRPLKLTDSESLFHQL